MIAYPHCKINLGLHILGRRSDGYHELETVFVPVFNLCDKLEIAPIDTPVAEVEQRGLALDNQPTDNLCYKAWQLMHERCNIPAVHIALEKHIPFGAGLGGGSSDAAFTLKMLNEMFHCGLSHAELSVMATRIGADCAFFLWTEPVYATGVGEAIEPIGLDLMGYDIKIEIPTDEHVSTREAYAGLGLNEGEVARESCSLKAALAEPIGRWCDTVVNDFEASVFQSHPAIEQLKLDMYRQGALYASMTGSGAAVFGIFAKEG